MKTILMFIAMFMVAGSVAAGPATLSMDLSHDKALWVDGLSGDDANAGTSEGAPFKTIQKAYDNLTADGVNWYKHIFIKASISYDLTTPLVLNVPRPELYGIPVLSGYGTHPGDGVKAVITDLGSPGLPMIALLSSTGNGIVFNSLDMTSSGSGSSVMYGTYNGGTSVITDCRLRSGGDSVVNFSGAMALRAFNSYFSMQGDSGTTLLRSGGVIVAANCAFVRPIRVDVSSTAFVVGNGYFYNCYFHGGGYITGYNGGNYINCTFDGPMNGLFQSNSGMWAVINCVLRGNKVKTTTSWWGNYGNTTSLIEGGNIIDKQFKKTGFETFNRLSSTDTVTDFNISDYTARPFTYNRGVNIFGEKQDSGTFCDTSYYQQTTFGQSQ